MKIQIDTENKIINAIGVVNLRELIDYLDVINIEFRHWKLGEVISPTPIILSNPEKEDTFRYGAGTTASTEKLPKTY